MGCSGHLPKQSIPSAFYIGFSVGRKRGWNGFFLGRNQNRTDTEALAEALAPDTRHKRRAQHGSQPPCCCHRAVEDATQHVYDCTVRETPHFPIYSTPPCTQGLSPNRKMRFPARFFRVGSWIFDTWSACVFQACSKLSLFYLFWHFDIFFKNHFFFDIFFKNQIPEFTYIRIPHEKNKPKRLSFGHTCYTHADHV